MAPEVISMQVSSAGDVVEYGYSDVIECAHSDVNARGNTCGITYQKGDKGI